MASFCQRIVMRTSEFIASVKRIIKLICNTFHNQHDQSWHDIPYIPVPELVDVPFEAEAYQLAVMRPILYHHDVQHHIVQIPPAA